jgi:hypothetical protein
VRNKELNGRLRALAVEVSARLAAELGRGTEIPFEVAEKPGSRSVLYHYKPLSAQFVRERIPTLRDLAAYAPAVEGLAAVEGCSAYLRVLGASYVPAAPRDRAEAALREFLARVWEDSTTLEFEAPGFDRAYVELESIVFEDTVINTVAAPLIGVALAAERWELGSGVALVRGDLSDAPPEAVWASGREDDEPNTVLVLTAEARPEEPAPLTEARMCFRKLLSAVRLLKPGAASLGPSAWWRTDTGPWQTVPLGFAGRSRGNPYVLEPDERSELMEIFELLRLGRATRGSLSWALSRFELGCEQPVALDGLSDYLLSARALLDAGEPPAVGVALRLAALCAEPADQRAVQMRTEAAFKLERLVMRGDVDAGFLATNGVASPEALVRDLEADLRALLRDAIAGHLPADLRSVADEILAEPTGRHEVAEPETDYVVSRSVTEPAEPPATAGQPVEPLTGEMDALLDEDAADYSAAV